MTTTIQVRNETKETLHAFKKQFNVKTYDAAIGVLVRTKAKSLYGSLAGRGQKSSFKKALKILQKARETSDRFKNIP